MYFLLSVLCFIYVTSICCYSITGDSQVIKIVKPESENILSRLDDDWTLRYFPDNSYKPPYNPRTHYFADKNDLEDVDPQCDDGKTNLFIDWNDSLTSNYSCPSGKWESNEFIEPIVRGDQIPFDFNAPNFCMNQEIIYPEEIVTFGGYRPLWAKNGEYKFLPKQRWLHNAEHGAVIMLYHPCAPEEQVDKLRKLVTSCLYRHIISPYNLLPKERPLALITWGWYIGLNTVRPKLMTRFIMEHALRGPKNIISNGKYNYGLIRAARVVSDHQDSVLCQEMSMM